MALRLLSRSAAALVAQQLGPAAQRLPSDWNPFASLAGDLDVSELLACSTAAIWSLMGSSGRPDVEGACEDRSSMSVQLYMCRQ